MPTFLYIVRTAADSSGGATTLSDNAGTPVLMKLYWSLRTNALRSG